MKIIFLLLSSLINFFCYSQRYDFGKISISNNGIDTIYGFHKRNQIKDTTSYIFNNYEFWIIQDSTIGKCIEVSSIVRNYNSPGTRNILVLDSMSRPTEFNGNVNFDDSKYKYKWIWNKEGRLLYIEEYINNVFSRTIKH